MNIFIYSDESGVLDKVHNDFFVFAGIVLLSKNERDEWSRRYLNAEKAIRIKEHGNDKGELKATAISNKAKGKLYRSLNNAEKFGVVVHQKELHDKVFAGKKVKQRYLDWVFKLAVKRKLEDMIERNLIDADQVENVYVFVDEHTTATNGIYELEESMYQEFKYGRFDYNWNIYYPYLFKNMKGLKVSYCDSSTKTLIRASDIIANKLYHNATIFKEAELETENFNIIRHPLKKK